VEGTNKKCGSRNICVLLRDEMSAFINASRCAGLWSKYACIEEKEREISIRVRHRAET
jgi:hypothetical protein